MTNIKCKIFDSQGKYICEKDIAENTERRLC